MAVFVMCRGEDPDYINVADIVSLSYDEKETNQIALLRDGREVTLVRNAMVKAVLTAFPAQPGQYLLLAYKNNDSIHFSREPLVAWGVSVLDGELRPMTANSDIEDLSNEVARAVLNTDGRVTAECARYPSEDDWRVAVQDFHKNVAALKLAAAKRKDAGRQHAS